MRVFELVNEGARASAAAKSKGIDAPVAEIANQQVIAEHAEIGGSECQAPGGVEHPLRSEAADHVSIGVEFIDEAIPCTPYVIVMDRVLQRKGNKEVAPNVLNAEGRETLGWWSWYRTIARQRRVGEVIDEVKVSIELVYLAEAKIGGVE